VEKIIDIVYDRCEGVRVGQTDSDDLNRETFQPTESRSARSDDAANGVAALKE